RWPVPWHPADLFGLNLAVARIAAVPLPPASERPQPRTVAEPGGSDVVSAACAPRLTECGYPQEQILPHGAAIWPGYHPSAAGPSRPERDRSRQPTRRRCGPPATDRAT